LRDFREVKVTDRLPAPPVPPDVDLRDFPSMMMEIDRLFASEFHARSDDAAWRAGVTLYLKSFHRVPAASLPDDDVSLARYAELGRDLRTWRRIKEAALHGWAKYSDGLLYHRVVAEIALEGWIKKLGQRKSSAAGNAKRYGVSFDPTLIDAAIEDAIERLEALNPSSRMLGKHPSKPSRPRPDESPEPLPSEDPNTSQSPPASPPGGSPETLPPGSQGKGREGKKREEKKRSSSSAPAVCQIDDDDLRNRLTKAANGNVHPHNRDLTPIRRLMEKHDLATILLAVAETVPFAKQRLNMWSAKFISAKVDEILEARLSSPPATPFEEVVFIAESSALWPQLEKRSLAVRRLKNPNATTVPRTEKNGVRGWYFPASMVAAARAEVPAADAGAKPMEAAE